MKKNMDDLNIFQMKWNDIFQMEYNGGNVCPNTILKCFQMKLNRTEQNG